MNRRRRAENEQTSPATDMLACGLGAAMILTLLFIGRTGDTEVKEEGLVLVELHTFGRFLRANMVDRWTTHQARDATCIALSRRGEALLQSCLGDTTPCQPLPPGVNGVCDRHGYALVLVTTETIASELSINFSWRTANAKSECTDVNLFNSDPLFPVLSSLLFPHIKYSITELGGFQKTLLYGSWTLPGNPASPSPAFLAAAQPVKDVLIPGATTQEQACDMVLTNNGVELTPARARGEDVELVMSKL